MAAQQSSVLSKPLSQFAAQLGALPTNVGEMTLEELGDFTSGVPVDTPPRCVSPSQQGTGCICVIDTQTNRCISARPTVEQYDAQDLVEYYRNLQVSPPPGPYFYSDVSTGIIGLLLGGSPSRPLDNSALLGWSNRVESRITRPLGMTRTFLNPPSGQTARGVAGGYDQALVTAQVSGGQITGFDPPSNGGSNYVQSMPPAAGLGLLATVGFNRRRRLAAESGDYRLRPRLHRARKRKFESISLQRRVSGELGSGSGCSFAHRPSARRSTGG